MGLFGFDLVASSLKATPVRAMLAVRKAVLCKKRNEVITEDEDSGMLIILDQTDTGEEEEEKRLAKRAKIAAAPEPYVPAKNYGVHHMNRIKDLPFPMEEAIIDGWDPGRENITAIVDMNFFFMY